MDILEIDVSTSQDPAMITVVLSVTTIQGAAHAYPMQLLTSTDAVIATLTGLVLPVASMLAAAIITVVAQVLVAGQTLTTASLQLRMLALISLELLSVIQDGVGPTVTIILKFVIRVARSVMALMLTIVTGASTTVY